MLWLDECDGRRYSTMVWPMVCYLQQTKENKYKRNIIFRWLAAWTIFYLALTVLYPHSIVTRLSFTEIKLLYVLGVLCVVNTFLHSIVVVLAAALIQIPFDLATHTKNIQIRRASHSNCWHTPNKWHNLLFYLSQGRLPNNFIGSIHEMANSIRTQSHMSYSSCWSSCRGLLERMPVVVVVVLVVAMMGDGDGSTQENP